MSNKPQTKAYKALDKGKCPRCRHKGRDVRFRPKLQKILCNNCVGDIVAKFRWKANK